MTAASTKQVSLVAHRCNQVGLTDRDAALAFCGRVARRELESRNDLTAEEAPWVLTVLDTWRREGADPTRERSDW